MIRKALVAAFLLISPCVAQSPSSIEILPDGITLSGPQSSHRLIVQGRFADGSERDLTANAAFEASDPKVVSMDNGVLRPLANGRSQADG